VNGKGSRPRPFSVDRKTYESNWDKIFGKKPKKKVAEKSSKRQKQDI
jgi:predicted nucleic acid-binding Zn ribbon protein